MLPPDIEALARSLIPGEGAVSLQRLGTGLFNSSYRVIREGVEYSLRVPVGSAPISQDFAWEIRVLRQAGRAGLAPPLIHADEASGVLLLRWVRGDTWSEQAARSPEAIDKMALLLRAVHSLPMPAGPRRMNPADWIESYSRAMSRQSGAAGLFTESAARAIGSLQRAAGAGSAGGLPQRSASSQCAAAAGGCRRMPAPVAGLGIRACSGWLLGFGGLERKLRFTSRRRAGTP